MSDTKPFDGFGIDDGVGIDHMDLGKAMCTMIAMTHPQTHSVASMSLAFNARPEDIRTAVEEYPWLYASWRSDETEPAKQLLKLTANRP